MTRFALFKAWLLASPPSWPKAAVLALACTVFPTLLELWSDDLATGTTFVTYFPFVVTAAVVLGWRWALGMVLASTSVANYLFMEPRYTFFAGFGDTVGSIFFVVSSAFVVWICETLRSTLRDLENARSREAYLNSELEHRVKNTLTVIQGFAIQTFRLSPDKETVDKFIGRLHALSEAQAVLTSGEWEARSLPDLAVRALSPFKSGRLKMDGPACALPEASIIPLVLALHELGTNSVKYGSLSVPTGTVDVRWRLASEPAGELILEWRERDGPAVQPPTRKGLGSRLLQAQNGLESVEMDFKPCGLCCRINVRLG